MIWLYALLYVLAMIAISLAVSHIAGVMFPDIVLAQLVFIILTSYGIGHAFATLLKQRINAMVERQAKKEAQREMREHDE